MTILRRIAYLRLAELWSLPHLTGEASPTSPIGSLWSHGVTRTANTPMWSWGESTPRGDCGGEWELHL